MSKLLDPYSYCSKDTRSAAAADLMRALDSVELRIKQAYGKQPMTRLMERVKRAREVLKGML
jgi:hypothetical protein